MSEPPVSPLPVMTVRRDLVFWGIVLAGFLTLVWLLSDVLLPFVLGMAIAYVVDPVVTSLERRGFSRGADGSQPGARGRSRARRLCPRRGARLRAPRALLRRRPVARGSGLRAGNIVSDYLIAPRVVGDRINVHPLWVLFGLFAGGALFGFVGMLISVPMCALIGVVARFAIAQYRASAYYRGSAA